MNTLKEKLIKLAQDTYKEILPCPSKGTFKESFTVENNKVYFWFNTADNSTHVMSEKAI